MLLTRTPQLTRDLQWDRALSSLVIRSGLGFSFGVIFSVLLFKRRAWPVWLGTGFGAGRAWEEADGILNTAPNRRDALY
jgi:MICOS complex subunit MIC10